MDFSQIIHTIIVGIVEGVTEFLPVSSTAHIILTEDLLGFKAAPGKVFEIAIQLGAIMAVCFKFWRRIMVMGLTVHKKPESRRFVARLFVAFLPAMCIGAVAHDYIEKHFFNEMVIGITFILGGVIIILIENMAKITKYETVDDITIPTALKIGFFQCIAMIPGVSRSGATIMSSIFMGVSRPAAAEFSFFLAIPTMFAATVYDIYKNRHDLHADGLGLIAIGFIVAFISALFVVNKLIDFISKHGFKPFAYYRIVVGVIILALVFLK